MKFDREKREIKRNTLWTFEKSNSLSSKLYSYYNAGMLIICNRDFYFNIYNSIAIIFQS